MTAAGADKGSRAFTGPLRCTISSGLHVYGTPRSVHPDILFIPVSVSWRMCAMKSSFQDKLFKQLYVLQI